MEQIIDLSHEIEHEMVTYPGLPGPRISDHLSREASRAVYAPGTEFHIGRIEMVANTGTYLDSPYHRYEGGTDLAGLDRATLVDRRAEVFHLEAVAPGGTAQRETPASAVHDPHLRGAAGAVGGRGWLSARRPGAPSAARGVGTPASHPCLFSLAARRVLPGCSCRSRSAAHRSAQCGDRRER